MVFTDDEHDFLEQWWKEEKSNEFVINTLLSIVILSNTYSECCKEMVEMWSRALF